MRIDFQPPRLFTRALLRWWAAAFVGFGVGVVAVEGDRALDGAALWWPHLPWLAVALVALTLLRRTGLALRGAFIELRSGALWLPATHESNRVTSLGLTELDAVDLRGPPGREVIVLAGAGKRFVYPVSALVRPDFAAPFVDAVKLALGETSEGLQRLREMVASDLELRELFSKRLWLTPVILGTLVGCFAAEVLPDYLQRVPALVQRFPALRTWMSIGQSPLYLVTLGANSPTLVQQGQWWRLISGAFLHGNEVHLLVNGFSLWSLCSLNERVLGPVRTWILYISAAVGGALASCIVAKAPISVGASGAVFGLLGALAVLQLRDRGGLPLALRQSRRWWFWILLINGGLSVFVPQIDGAAHAGGFVAGALATLCFTRPTPGAPVWPNAPVVLAVALAVLTAVAFLETGLRAVRHAAADRKAVFIAYDEWPQATAELRNALAFGLALARDADNEELTRAEQAMRRAIDEQPSNAAFLDTHATVLHRLGRSSDAIAIEARVLGDVPDPLFATQLARFVRATGTPDAGASQIDAALTRDADAGATVVLTARGDGMVGPAFVFVEDEASGARAYVLVCPRTQERMHQVGLPAAPDWLRAAQARVTISVLLASEALCRPGLSAPALLLPHDPQVDAWP